MMVSIPSLVMHVPLVVIEHMLGGVAMVNVPVHNQYTVGVE